MKILAWNVQGAKKSQITEEIRFIQKLHKPDIVFLIETMVSEEHTNRLISRLGFQKHDFINPINHSGGIWVLWNEMNIRANVLLKDNRAIHMLVFEYSSQKFSIISGIYAPTKAIDKDDFWTYLRNLNDIIDMPWCLIGDFNELECPSDKLGGQAVTPSRVARLPTFLQSIRATSIPMRGCPFTWKKRIHGHLIYEKLDRAIGRQDWYHPYPDSVVIGGPFTCSDHTYIILNTESAQIGRKKPIFRYQPHWSSYQEVTQTVRKIWSTRVTGSPMFRITQKLRATKRELKSWSSRRFGNVRRQVEQNTERLKFVESQLIINPNSPRLNNWHFRLIKQREHMLLFNKRFWGTFARKSWLVDGDRQSRFFHQSIKNRKDRFSLIRIRDDTGVWLEHAPIIQQKFIADFTARFTSSRHSPSMNLRNLALPSISAEENLELTKAVTVNEIYSALFDMDPHKAPGPDGFSASFFQDHWPIIKDQLCFAIKDFFQSGKMLKEVNHTFIALIPKVENPETTTQFRPISLCNTTYKIIARILVNRMRPILQRLIHPCQSAFVPNRAIHDNILVAHEIMNKFRHSKGKRGYVALKLDMEKAYDRIEWDFLFNCLQQLGFDDKWITWIRECVSTVTYSILLNGESCGHITPSRGLRQGDPLSPYLFLICMDILARRLYAHSLTPKSGLGIKIAPAAMRIPCLLFADDSLIFCKTSSEACRQLKNLLDLFCTQSGQLINFHKSSLIFSKNTCSTDKQLVAGIFNISHSSALGKYLGCSIFMGRPRADHFQNLLAKAVTKLDSWKAKCFSKAGRVVLIQSHLEGLPSHTMQCFQLPASVSDKLDRINREFFWKNSSSRKGIPLIAWDKICYPKKFGGLGLRKTAAVNLAFLAKLAWKFLTTPGNLWVQMISAKYGNPDRFFTCKTRQSDSWVWKCILRLRPFIKQGLRWKLGNGKSINFWTDAWCLDVSLENKLGLDLSTLPDANCKVCDFITPGKQWDTAKLTQALPPDLVQAVQGIPIPVTDIPDSFCWGLTGNGEFSTKSATWKAHGITSEQPVWKYKWVWKVNVMPKIKIFLWQLCHNSLPTRGTLLRRGLQLDPTCPACLHDIEDTDHIFLHCPMVRQTWDLAAMHHWLPILPAFSSDLSIRDHLHDLANQKSPHLARIALLLWSIWKSRNALIFKHENPNAMGTLLRAKRSWAEWKLRTSNSLTFPSRYSQPSHLNHHPPKIIHYIRWKSPAGGDIKINCDGAKSPRGTSAGFIIRSWTGRMILAGTRFLEHAPILVAEATAVRDGIIAALEAGYRRLAVEGDNQVVISALQSRIKPPWQIASIIEDIKNLAKGGEDISFIHIYREGNRAADWIAKHGSSIRSTYLTLFHYPPSRELQCILAEDYLGRSLARETI